MPRKTFLMGTIQKERKNLAAVPNPRNRNFDIPPDYHNFFDSTARMRCASMSLATRTSLLS